MASPTLNRAAQGTVPGLPVEVTSVSEFIKYRAFLDKLYTLTYIKHNSMKTVMLYLEDEPPIDEVVRRSKRLCSERFWTFSRIERSVISLPSER